MKSNGEYQYQLLMKNLNNIKNIDKPSSNIIQKVLLKKAELNQIDKELTPSLHNLFVFHYPEAINFIKNPNDSILKLAFSKNVKLALNYENLSLELQEFIISKHSHYAQYIKNLDISIQENLMKKSKSNISYINNPTLEIQELAFDYAINYFWSIKNPNPIIVKKLCETSDFKNNQKVYIKGILSHHKNDLCDISMQYIINSVSLENRDLLKNHPNYKNSAEFLLSTIDNCLEIN